MTGPRLVLELAYLAVVAPAAFLGYHAADSREGRWHLALVVAAGLTLVFAAAALKGFCVGALESLS